MRVFKVFLLSIGLLLINSSCAKDESVPQSTAVDPEIEFSLDATVNSTPLIPNSKWYSNFSGDSFTVTKFNYYISNLRFKRNDGFIYSEQNSYHLMKHVEGKNSFVVNGIPEGIYTEIEFVIGVDSARNVSGSQSGDLDVAQNMFWDWNTGYIFYKLEGIHNTLSAPLKSDYAIHVGGFSGKSNHLKTCNFKLVKNIEARLNKRTKVFYEVKLEEIFVKPLFIDFDYYQANIQNNISKELADNYKDMFVVKKVENE